jgi:hypothetical protein
MSTTSTALTGSAQDTAAIRPFRVDAPQADVDELRRRLAATR